MSTVYHSTTVADAEAGPSIVGKLDRVTGRPASIYTPPEDLR